MTYDARLARLPHYTRFPSMLPHVGSGYARTRTLIIGESHYLPKGSDIHHDEGRWYGGADAVGPVPILTDVERRYMDTRGVLAEYGQAPTTLAFRIYLNVDHALRDIGSGLSLRDDFAFLNYFQRPAQQTGRSIEPGALDREVAYDNLLAVCGILECARVLFVSKRAYWAFLRERRRRDDSRASFEVYGFSHPATSWWNRETDQSHNGFPERRTNRAAFGAVVRAGVVGG